MKSPLEAALETPTSGQTPKLCIVGRVIDDHPEAEVIKKALEDPRWSHGALASALFANDIRLNAMAISRHRRKLCSCLRVAKETA